MANPRQRRKARSSSYRPVSHSRHAKRNLKKAPPIRGPKALQEAWDKKRTVRQNYARLGLAASLDPFTRGGIEQILVSPAHHHPHQLETPSTAPSVDTLEKGVPTGFGRIIRNAAGSVIAVELNEIQPEEAVDVEDIDNVDSRIDPEVRKQWASGFAKGNASNVTLINELQRMSASMSASTSSGVRHVSGGQMKYLEALVKKHGENVKAMAADLKLNPEQRTIGQIRRALKSASLLTVQPDCISID